jgi:tripartite ATP-independent transporter DctM subunit
MDPILVGTLGILFLFVILALGFHIGLALTISGFTGLLFILDFNQTSTMVVSAFYHKISKPALITLPLFILMGHLASGGGISQNIYDSLSKWLGKLKSGLGISTVLACTAFGTVCGASIVVSAVFSKISAPEMRRHGYHKTLAYAICASSGAIGMLIPPSILAIVYGTMSGVSIGKVLMAGVAPGVLVAISFSLAIIITSKINPNAIVDTGERKTATWKERIHSLKAWWSIVIVSVTLFGGMYGGVFSPSEAAAVAAFVLLVIYLLRGYFGRNGKNQGGIARELRDNFTETAITSAMIFFIFGGATVFSQFIVLTGVTSRLSEMFLGTGLSPKALVFVFCCIYLILGIFLDGISIVCITVPVFNPIIKAAGVDPIWYAALVILSIEIGLITPPVGLNLYASKGVAEPDVTLEDIVKGILPFFLGMIAVLLFLFLFPSISTYLPSFI